MVLDSCLGKKVEIRGKPADEKIEKLPADDKAEAKPEKEKKPAPELAKEYGGRDGPEATRYGDWEKNGIISDF